MNNSVVAQVRARFDSATADQLRSEDWWNETILFLGLNDEVLSEQPPELAAHYGGGLGLRIWQYPIQFVPYLIWLCGRAHAISSYVEIGVRHGGTFIVHVELLRRLNPNFKKAVAVDAVESSAILAEYIATDGRTEYRRGNSFDLNFEPFDLAFIDGDHSWAGVVNDVSKTDAARVLVLHDISSVACPQINEFWRIYSAAKTATHTATEFTAQYESVHGHFLGIGVLEHDRPSRPALDIAYVLPVTFGGKYVDRLRAFRKYGLLNRKTTAMKVYFLCGPESVPPEFAPDTWPYPVEFVNSPFQNGGIKNYAFGQYITPEIAATARWWYKIDDDSINDVAGTVERLDADYDWTQPLYICGDYGGGLEPVFFNAIARSTYSTRILLENQRDKAIVHHERESSFLSGPCMQLIAADKECRRFFDFICQPVNDHVGCFGDQGWAVAARFVRVHQVDCMFTTQWPLVTNFSLFGGRFTHIHFVHPECPDWQLFLDIIDRHNIPTG